MFSFNRSQLFWYGVAVIFGVFVFYRLFLLITWEHTRGQVVGFDVVLHTGETVRFVPQNSPQGLTARWSVVAFTYNNDTYRFMAGENLRLPLREQVPVVHSRTNPNRAFVNTFFGFWFRPLMILPHIAWAVVVMGLTGRNSYWTIRWFPFRVTRTDIQRRRDLH